MMKNVMSATAEAFIGHAMFNFIVKRDGGRNGPEFVTRRQNPREANDDSIRKFRKQIEQKMKGLVRDRPEFGVFFGVKPCWIANLDEIRAYKGDGAPPRIEWTEEGANGIAELFNGN